MKTMKQMKLWMLAAILVISGTSVLTSCSKDDDDNNTVVQPVKEYFTLWNQCEALTTLQFNIDGEQQQVNTADITAPATPAAVRMRLAGKLE